MQTILIIHWGEVSSIAGTLACMIWKGTPYYAHIDYNDRKEPADDLPDEASTYSKSSWRHHTFCKYQLQCYQSIHVHELG
jgi:hypothetical protein